MSKGGGGDQIWTMTEKGGGGKKFNILPDVLCEWLLILFLHSETNSKGLLAQLGIDPRPLGGGGAVVLEA